MENLRKKKVCVVLGTRPEAVKMAPLIIELKKHDCIDVFVLTTGQHRDTVSSIFNIFEISSDDDLSVMRPNQSLASLTAVLFEKLSAAFDRICPDVVLAQGDTTSVFVASVLCLYKNIKFGHVEAGLRSGNISDPMPEEFNRIVAASVSSWSFAPTLEAKKNLLNEKVKRETITVTGNTGIDALRIVSERMQKSEPATVSNSIKILVTLHRREIFGSNLSSVIAALKRIATRYKDVSFIWPVHPNPNVKIPIYDELDNHSSFKLLPPLDYFSLIKEMSECKFIVTDSGGLQEEGPYLNKPVLVVRNTTERPEAVSLGVAKVIGYDENDVYKNIETLIIDKCKYKEMSSGGSPYGDGYAAERIVKTLVDEVFF